MRRQLLENISGQGRLHQQQGAPIPVHYSIEHFRDLLPGAPGQEDQPGPQSIEGYLFSETPEKFVELQSEALTLELQDGRRLRIQLSNLQGSFTATGGFF